MSEQQSIPEATVETWIANWTPSIPNDAWGKPISEERQAELQGYLDRWQDKNHRGERIGPFHGVLLTGADVFWLAMRVRDINGCVPDLHLEGVDLSSAYLVKAKLRFVHLDESTLVGTHLSEADLGGARLDRAELILTDLERASLRGSHLEGATLIMARLQGADLNYSWFDSTTSLADIFLNHEIRLGDIHWGGLGSVDLTSIHWNKVDTLGDELDLGHRATVSIPIKGVSEYESVVRAYRQVAVQLRAQGITEVADRFAYRAHIMKRTALRHQSFKKWPAYLASLILDLISGYGYRPMRSLFTYAFVVLAFAFGYFLLRENVHPALNPIDSLIFSITSFHGRGFMPGENVNLHNPLTIVAASEAIIGLLIEITFIATFTQRFFAR